MGALSPILTGVGPSSVSFADGSAVSPSIAFASDLNTGIFRVLADTLGISTGGVERLRVGTQLLLPTAGSVAAPDLAFAATPGSGMFQPFGDVGVEDFVAFSVLGKQILNLFNNAGADSGIQIEGGDSGVWPTTIRPTTARATEVLHIQSKGAAELNLSGGTTVNLMDGVQTQVRADASAMADDTGMLVYDVTAAALKRVSRGVVDSGGLGFRLLRIAN